MITSPGQPDVIIVGLGPAGATAAYALTKAGMRVLALEAGPQRRMEEYRLDELTESVFQRARLGPKFNTELQTWRRAEGEMTRAATYSLGKMNNGVGGTVVYSAWLRRYMPNDFKTRTGIIERYGEDALLRFGRSLAPASAREAIDAVVALIAGFGAGLDDDVALLALGRRRS